MTRPRVLIVDDDPSILLMLEEFFERAGAAVTAVSRGAQALDATLSQLQLGTPFDMMIIDIRMPEMNGHVLTKKVRSAGYQGAIIAFTANATGEGWAEGQEVGITTYLSKHTLSKKVVQALLYEHCRDKMDP